MADSWRRRSALAAAYAEGGDGAVSIRERRPLEMVQFSSWDDRANAAGIALPPPRRAAASGDVTALWIGPRRWLLVARDGADLLRRLADAGGILVDQSEGRTVLRLSGSPAREVMAKGTGIDLHPQAFGPGACASTLLGHVGVVLHVVDDAAIDLYVARSYALTLWEWLMESAAEFGVRIEPAEAS